MFVSFSACAEEAHVRQMGRVQEVARPDTVVHGDAAVQPLPVARAAVVVRVLVRRYRARHAVHHRQRAQHREAGVQDRRPFHRARRRGGQEEDDGLRGGTRGGCALPRGGASRRPLARHGAGARARAHEPQHVKYSCRNCWQARLMTVMYCCRSCTARLCSPQRKRNTGPGSPQNRAA